MVPSRSKRVGSRFFAFVEERADTTSQTFVRLTVLILVTLVAFSAVFDLDIVLGSFAAGFVLRYIIPEGNHTLETRAKRPGLRRLFHSGVLYRIGRKDRPDGGGVAPGLLAGFIVALLIIRAVPILISMSICPATRDVSAYRRITVALYSPAALPIIVAVTSVAVNAGALSQDIASVMVAAGAITVFLMPHCSRSSSTAWSTPHRSPPWQRLPSIHPMRSTSCASPRPSELARARA